MNRRPKAYESSALPLSYSGGERAETCRFPRENPIKISKPKCGGCISILGGGSRCYGAEASSRRPGRDDGGSCTMQTSSVCAAIMANPPRKECGSEKLAALASSFAPASRMSQGLRSGGGDAGYATGVGELGARGGRFMTCRGGFTGQSGNIADRILTLSKSLRLPYSCRCSASITWKIGQD